MSRIDPPRTGAPEVPLADAPPIADEKLRRVQLSCRAARDVPTLSASRHALIRQRLLYRKRVGAGRRPSLALVAAVLLFASGGAFGAMMTRWIARTPPTTTTTTTTLSAGGAMGPAGGARAGARPARAGAEAIAVVEAPLPRPAPDTGPEPEAVPGPARAPSAPRRTTRAPASGRNGAAAVVAAPAVAHASPAPAEPATAPPPPLPTEQALLARAWRALRVERDPAAALHLLDAHAARFPDGSLRPEARIARVETLMALGRATEARQLVEQPGRDGDVRLRVLRGELRAEAGLTASALEDFAAALRQKGPGAALARALYGQAVCLARLGRSAEARDAYRQYLARFPAGRDAARARAALAGGEAVPPPPPPP
jgi:hypothetical protein